MSFIPRQNLLDRINQAFRVNRIVCLLGPRQCGKTTLARLLWDQAGKCLTDFGYFDLEKPTDKQALAEPDLVLPTIEGLVVIDEIQRQADLFPYLRYLYDKQLNQKFLILGSAARDLIQQSSESLAGRISYIEVMPFSLLEIDNWKLLWLKGGFPRSYLLDDLDSMTWRENYMRTYVEQDLRNIGFEFQTETLRRLWFMLAHYHGQIINFSELAGALSVSQPTVVKYISYLAGSFMIRILKPWHENIKKRQVKSPKVYFKDSGLLHYVLGINQYTDIFKSPKAGASFEGFAMEEVIKCLQADNESCYFWASHNHAELDLLVLRQGKKYGFEFKLSEAPTLTPSMRIALTDLQLDRLCVIYPGESSYRLTKQVDVFPITQVKNLSSLLLT